MAFGKRKQRDDTNDVEEDVLDKGADKGVDNDAVKSEAPVVERTPWKAGDVPAAVVTADDGLEGPFEIEDFDDPEVATVGRLDLGSVLIPLPAAGQVQVELSPTGVPSTVWVVTPNGRFTIA